MKIENDKEVIQFLNSCHPNPTPDQHYFTIRMFLVILLYKMCVQGGINEN